jgi:hypothetical protein
MRKRTFELVYKKGKVALLLDLQRACSIQKWVLMDFSKAGCVLEKAIKNKNKRIWLIIIYKIPW